MQAKIKCSNCGAEITNLNMSWGRRQWVWIIVIIFVMTPFFIYSIWLENPKGDYSKELSIKLLNTRYCEDRIDVFGEIMNIGKHDWSYIETEAEFYNKNGVFLDKNIQSIPGILKPSMSDKFKITFKKPYKELSDTSASVVLKVAGASINRF